MQQAAAVEVSVLDSQADDQAACRVVHLLNSRAFGATRDWRGRNR